MFWLTMCPVTLGFCYHRRKEKKPVTEMGPLEGANWAGRGDRACSICVSKHLARSCFITKDSKAGTLLTLSHTQPPAHWLPEPHLKPGISKQAPGLRQCPHSCHCDNVPLQESLTWGGYILVTNYRWNDTFRTLGLPRVLVSHLHCARSFLLGLWGRVVVACGLLLSPNIRRGHYTHVPSSEKFINF